MSTGFTDPRRLLTAPTVAMLPRAGDSLSFLYLENVRITQDDTGVCAAVQHPDGTPSRIYLPVAALSCLLLGTGTSTTQPAMATCAATTPPCCGPDLAVYGCTPPPPPET